MAIAEATSGVKGSDVSRSRASWRFVLAGMSGVLLALPLLNPQFYLFSWFSLVPLLFSVRGSSFKQSYFLSVFSGLIFYLIGTYWVWPFIVNMKGYSAVVAALISCLFWLYSAHVIAIIILLWKTLAKALKWGGQVLFPALLVTVFSLFPNVFPIQFGGGQSHFLLATQATDIAGLYGLDFVIALSNICLYGLLSPYLKTNSWTEKNTQTIKSTQAKHQTHMPYVLSGVFILVWFAYGYYSLSFWEQQQSEWPTKKIGIVQSNNTPSIAIPDPQPGYGWSYPPEMEMTEQLAQAGAQIVFWPESRYKGYFASDYVQAAYLNRIKKMKIPLVFQDMERVNSLDDETKEYNTMVLLSDQGAMDAIYRKQKRIAFGEYMPILEHNDRLRVWAESAVGDFLANISKGDDRTKFSAAGMQIIPLICFEAIFSDFVAEAVTQSSTEGGGGVLVAASFDGWFGQSLAPFQHLALSTIRAVENRVPLIHVINNGPSAVVMPSGRVIAQTTAFTKVAVTVDMPYSENSGGSFYSRYPHAFLYGVYGLLLIILIKYIIGFVSSSSRQL